MDNKGITIDNGKVKVQSDMKIIGTPCVGFNFMDMKYNNRKILNNGKPVLVTPQMAKRWLEISKGFNPRKLDLNHVSSLSHDIISGNHTIRTIAFHKNGLMGDGQHVASAIVSTGMSINLWIEVGLDDADISHLDIGKTRSYSVTSKGLGMKTSGGESSLAGVLEYGFDQPPKTLTHDERRFLVRKYREDIDIVNESFKSSKIKPVAMKKAFVDKYREVKNDPIKLKRLIWFGKVFSTLTAENGKKDQAALNLYKQLNKMATADRKTRHEVERLTSIAIDNFMEENPAKKIYMTNVQKKKFGNKK